MPVYVQGLRELNAWFAEADRVTRLGVRKAERDVAEPVRRDAQGLSVQTISRIGRKWSRMRVGATRSLVYVAPSEKGLRGRGRVSEARRRANTIFAGMLMDRAMEPALEQHAPQLEADVERFLDRLTAEFNAGGPTL